MGEAPFGDSKTWINPKADVLEDSNTHVKAPGVDPQVGGTSSFRRRNHLAAIEQSIQSLWDERRSYESDPPEGWSNLGTSLPDKALDFDTYPHVGEKFFCTFPYPYMNGRLHLGHAFSMTKAEFAARFHRSQNKNVLWPFAFHCTGMPIPACADKLKREISARQNPPTDDSSARQASTVPPAPEHHAVDKFASKKSKAVAKSGHSKSQWEILAACGVPETEIPNFQDANFWLEYFPPLAMKDLKRFGLAVDWRRSFVTTDRNPYYDAFIRWQFNTLKRQNKIIFGMRPTVYSAREGQACADHDRLSGEGLGPQEYTLIKLRLHDACPARWMQQMPQLASRQIFLVAATLRPETMCGQTNCFVLPSGEYGIFLAFGTPLAPVSSSANEAGVLSKALSKEAAYEACHSVFICSARSAQNMAMQGLLPLRKLESDTPTVPCEGNPAQNFNLPLHLLGTVTGIDLIGLRFVAPATDGRLVYSLPMLTISMEKGTGVVTSVPSDSPDDYVAIRDLRTKPALQEKFGVESHMVPDQVHEIIEVPNAGRRIAVDLTEAKKVASQNDRVALTAIKEEVYRRGFYEGRMVAGPFAGMKVTDAKPLARNAMIASGEACCYFEPEGLVVSRSGDACVVALCNQWYLDFGDAEWKAEVAKYISEGDDKAVTKRTFHAFSTRCISQFKHVVDWIQGWACSRSYGLGTLLPWEAEQGNRILIESLSDSTIYMAYYTIAHYLHQDIYGDTAAHPFGLLSNQLTDEVFDYIFMQTDVLPTSKCSEPIDPLVLQRMRNEFNYWYPMDLRVSGKDLIFNHLTMSLFIHSAMWPGKPTSKWPKSFFCNGHILVDAQKMSKAAGNFFTLEEALAEFTADATRLGLADAGDSLDDANFQRETANAAIMRLYLLEQFVIEATTIPEKSLGPNGLRSSGELTWPDRVFRNEIIRLTALAKQSYERMAFRDALKYSFFDFSSARDSYRQLTEQIGMHLDMIHLWIETQAVILAPIAPHICEHIWSILLKKPVLVVNTAWPRFEGESFDPALHRELQYVLSAVEEFRKARDKSVGQAASKRLMSVAKSRKQANPGASSQTTVELERAVIYVAKEYLPWQKSVLQVLQAIPLDEGGTKPLDTNYMTTIKCHPDIVSLDSKLQKEVMGFASFRMKEELPTRGSAAFELEMPYDEVQLLQINEAFIKKSLSIKKVEICSNIATVSGDLTNRAMFAMPSKPSIVFFQDSDPVRINH